MATTGTNPVDPNQLLKALSSLLTKEGGIKGATEVTKIIILMKSARKMVSRCIYSNILISTKEKDIQERFIAEGGWELLNSWLQEAKSNEQNPIIVELIKVFKELPVTIDILKRNNTAKIIKSFSKGDGEEDLKSMADDLVTTWMTVIRTANIEKEKEKSPSVKRKKKHKKVEKPVINDRDADDESEEPLTKKLRLCSVDGEPMDTSESVSASRTGESRLRHASEKSKTAKLSAAKSATSSRKGSSEDPLKKEANGRKPAPEKEGAKTKRTAKVVRPAHTKFRSTGLEKDADLPLPKIKKKTPVQPIRTEKPIPTLTIRKDGLLFSKSLSPTEKRPRPDEPAKGSHSGGYGKIKIIPARPKVIQESTGFLDALNAPSLTLKKKIPKKIVRTNSTGSIKAKSPTPPEEIKVEPPKFSFYSSNQPEEEKKEEEKKEEEKKEVEKKEEEKEVETVGDPTKEVGDMGDDWNEERPISLGKSNLKFGPSKSKKKVRWKEETDLVDIYYFILDETERVNVNKVKDFHDAMQNEKMMEKKTVLNARKLAHEVEEDKSNGNATMEYFQWCQPRPLEPYGTVVNVGVNSTEKLVQSKREQSVLQEIFFDQMNLPATPKEPDPETKKQEAFKTIPLEDEANMETMDTVEPAIAPLFPPDQGHFDNFGGFDMPGPGPGPGPGMRPPGGVPPMVGAPGGPLLPPPMQQQQQQRGPQGITPPSPNTTIKNVQNLLASLSEGEANKPGSDLLNKENLDKLKEMLEPFKNQMPDNQQRDERNMPPFPPPGPGNFGPGDFGPGPGDFGPGPRGPHPDPRSPFPMGPDGPMGMGHGHGPGPGPGPGPRPHFDGPGMGGPFGPRFGPRPNFPGPGRGMGPPGRGRGFPDRGMGPRGPWRGGRGRGRGKPVCYHFNTERGCLRGDKCHFLHPGVNGPPMS